MEDTEKSQLEEMLTCTVCRDIFKDPRQLPCGHSMCMHCLENMRDHSSDLPFRCPDCRSFFGQIIKVQKSYNLANIAENFRETRRRKEEQNKNVYCDCCPEKKVLAVKMCLKCEVSMCKEHVKDHQELPVFTGHPLVRPLGDLQDRKCPQHDDEVLRYYCNSSRRYLCNMCALEKKQQSHEGESFNVLRRQLTEYMEQHFTTLQEQIKESTKSVKRLKEDIQLNKLNASSSSLNSVSWVLLCLWFIVLYYAYNYSVENEMLTQSLDKQHNRVHELYSTVAEVLAKRPSEIRTPQETEDKGILMLDVDTASPFLGLSADFQTAERVRTKVPYPSSMKRFAEAPQVLSALCFSSGTHTWEVEAEGYWDIAVSYKSIRRRSKHGSAFGKNDNSWSLTHNSEGKLFAYHDGGKTVLPGTLQSRRISVVVHFEKGNITFSAVEESTITKLHEFKAKLTQPVCLGLGLYRVDPPSKASILALSAS